MTFCKCHIQTFELCHIFKGFTSRRPVVNLSSTLFTKRERKISVVERKISVAIQTTTTLNCRNNSVVDHNLFLGNIKY
jgi:hypothetical protein